MPPDDPATLGRDASSPAAIPVRGWRAVLRRVWREAISDRLGLVAAGCAFYATVALFPGLSVLISVYGLVFDPATVAPQLEVLKDVLPDAANTLIRERIGTIVSQDPPRLGLGIAIGMLVTLFSAGAAMRAMLSALNLAYEETERRSFLAFHLTALGFTLAGVLAISVMLATLVVLPAGLGLFGIGPEHAGTLRLVSFVILLPCVAFGLSLLYRFGPCRRSARWVWITPGSIVATLVWLAASGGLSFYVTNFAAYDATYGPLGAVVALMIWFWVSAYIVLLGAELNAELEHQTAADSTIGPVRPMGQRGAYVADTVAD